MADEAEITIVLPAIDDDDVSNGLYELSETLGTLNPDAQSHGFLGGEWGYGQDYRNDVFEMFPFWWGDCDCDESTPDDSPTIVHVEGCDGGRPNFLHYASGLRVDWYKYIGRGMELSKEVTAVEWASILEDCFDSLRAAGLVGDGSQKCE